MTELPLILVNANWSTAGIWSPLLGLLADRYRLIRYDDRGFGRSPAPAASFTRLGDLRGVMDRITTGPVVIVGHSGGGGTALGLALSDPERVAALVLIAPGVSGYPWPHDDSYFGEFVKLFAAGDREGLVRLGLATWAPAGDDAVVTTEISAAVTAFLTVGELEQPGPPAYDRLGEVRAPAVMVRGDREYPMVADCADAIASRIPGCRRIVISGADHMLPFRAPGQLADIIAGLLPAGEHLERGAHVSGTDAARPVCLEHRSLLDHAPGFRTFRGTGLFERIGGQPTIDRLVDLPYEGIGDDEQLRPLFGRNLAGGRPCRSCSSLSGWAAPVVTANRPTQA